ncbi:hypothetical protein ACEUA8_00175 [Aeromonas veronii]|uniref:hypothetical protein n=1 Tax=Aeromonas TaxID=642 RepID=UPI0013DFF032|nr:hypothetical protein [Aeromonas veronii]MBL0639571.1 hypothetical protein [Aeromonas veronii]QIF44485.1 hypothetical protein EO082_10885 [Aeromonas veronii]
MQLEEFVQSAIQQIARGVSNASDDVASLGGRVNPHDHIASSSRSPRLTNIDFDVALVVTESQQSEAGARLSVINVLSLGGKTQGNDVYQQTSRVKFTVAVELPKDSSVREEQGAALQIPSTVTGW